MFDLRGPSHEVSPRQPRERRTAARHRAVGRCANSYCPTSEPRQHTAGRRDGSAEPSPIVPVTIPDLAPPPTSTANKELEIRIAEIDSLRSQETALRTGVQDDDLKKKVEVLEKQIDVLQKMVKLLADQAKKQQSSGGAWMN